MTDIGKVVMGRLRPNFFALCNPTAKHVTALNYVTSYTCTGEPNEKFDEVWWV